MSKNITEVIRGVTEANMPTIVLGQILNLNPWKIQLVDDQNIILSDQSLIIPERVKRYAYDRLKCSGCNKIVCGQCGAISCSGGSGCGSFEWRKPLKKGDRLYMLAVNHCKIYYVLDRV